MNNDTQWNDKQLNFAQKLASITLGIALGAAMIAPPVVAFAAAPDDATESTVYTASGTGTGIGLALAREIVELHGWHIDATVDDDMMRMTITTE